jgi:hypothetical protein
MARDNTREVGTAILGGVAAGLGEVAASLAPSRGGEASPLPSSDGDMSPVVYGVGGLLIGVALGSMMFGRR